MWRRRAARLVGVLPDIRGRAQVARRLQPSDATSVTWSLRSNGFAFELPSSSSIAWRVACTREYDRAEVDYLSRFISPETTVLDIGASMGLWTVPLANVAKARGAETVAFEPMPANVGWLERNLALNDLEVTVNPVALGAEHGSAHMSTNEADGGNAVLGVDGPPGETQVEVPVRRLDDFSLPSRVSLVKVDVEGFEVEVLRGAMEMIRRDRPIIFGEFNPIWLEIREVDVGELFDDLRDLGYEIFALEATRTRPWMATRRVAPRQPADLGVGDLLLKPR